MDHIETKILNSYTIQEAAQNMVFAARHSLFITYKFMLHKFYIFIIYKIRKHPYLSMHLK